MSEGLLWQPDGDEDLAFEIGLATRRFYEKFGRQPTACRMMYEGEVPKTVRGIRIVHDATITKNHFLLCHEEIENGKV